MTVLRWDQFVPSGEAFHITTTVLDGRQGYPLHTHADFAECFLVDSGTGTHVFKHGRDTLRGGDLCLIRARDTHGFRPVTGQTCRYINLAFPCTSLEFIRKRYYPDQRDIWGGASARPAKFALDGGTQSELTYLLQDLSRRPREKVHIERFLLDLLDRLARRVAPVAPDAPAWLARALVDIKKPENLAEGLTAFLRLAGRSPEHVARETRRWTGKTPSDIINQARLDHAAHLLNMSHLDILDISLECGFQNLSHFYHLFRQRFGRPPRQYRLAQRILFGVGPQVSLGHQRVTTTNAVGWPP